MSEPKPGSTDNQAVEDPTQGKFSPLAGCSIFIIAGLIAAGMLTFLVWSYFQTRDMVEAFTDESPRMVETINPSGLEIPQQELRQKLLGFRQQVEDKQSGTISLNASEMNLAIASFEILQPHQGKLFIRKIQNGQITAEVSFPTKSRMRSDENRFINATLTIQPELVDGAPFPKITRIQTDSGAEVHEQFKQFIAETLLKPVYDDQDIGPIFQSLSAVEIKGDAVLASTNPTARSSGAAPDDNPQMIIDRLLKGFAIVAVVFLAFVTLIIILSRKKAKQS